MHMSSEALRQRLARRGAWRRTRSKHQGSSPTSVIERLRDQLFERAKHTPTFLESVFAIHERPTDEEILHSIENRLFTIIHEYPAWFGRTPDADAKAHDLKRDHDITHGFLKTAPLTENQKAAVARRKQERLEREQRIAARADEVLATQAS